MYQSTVFANRSDKATFRWKYTLGNAQLDNLAIKCGYIPPNRRTEDLKILVGKTGHTSRLSRVGALPGRFGSIETYQEMVGILSHF